MLDFTVRDGVQRELRGSYESLSLQKHKLTEELEVAQKDYKQKNKQTEKYVGISMKAYYRVKELEETIRVLDYAMEVLSEQTKREGEEAKA